MDEKKAKRLFNSFQSLKNLQSLTSGINLQQAKELAYMKKDKNYKTVIGYDEATWKAFIAQPELQPLTMSTANRLVTIYQKYIEELKLSNDDILGIDSNSLQRLATIVNEVNVKSWLHKAKVLSRSDLYREIKYGSVNEEHCEHDWEARQTSKCKFCGKTRTKKL